MLHTCQKLCDSSSLTTLTLFPLFLPAHLVILSSAQLVFTFCQPFSFLHTAHMVSSSFKHFLLVCSMPVPQLPWRLQNIFGTTGAGILQPQSHRYSAALRSCRFCSVMNVMPLGSIDIWNLRAADFHGTAPTPDDRPDGMDALHRRRRH